MTRFFDPSFLDGHELYHPRCGRGAAIVALRRNPDGTGVRDPFNSGKPVARSFNARAPDDVGAAPAFGRRGGQVAALHATRRRPRRDSLAHLSDPVPGPHCILGAGTSNPCPLLHMPPPAPVADSHRHLVRARLPSKFSPRTGPILLSHRQSRSDLQREIILLEWTPSLRAGKQWCIRTRRAQGLPCMRRAIALRRLSHPGCAYLCSHPARPV